MKKQVKGKSSPIKRIVQTVTTVLLIVCTLLCFVTVASAAFNQDASIFGFRLFYVVTGSMEPTLPVGSMLVVGESETYEVGDIITFYSKEESIKGRANTHRIHAITEEDGVLCYITKGDANSIADTIPVTQEDVIGKMYLCINTSFIKDLMEILGTPMGFFLLILLPLLLVSVVCMKKFKKALDEEMRRTAMAAAEAELKQEKETSENETEGNHTTE